MSFKNKRTAEYPLFRVSGPPPFQTIGLFTFLRTYARRHDETDPKSTIESWQECIERVVTSCNSQLKVGFTEDELQEVFSLLYNLKCSVAGRFMWQLGTRTVDNLGLPSLQNCFRSDTDFWTIEGVKCFKEFRDGESVTIRGKDNWMPAIVKNFGVQEIVKLTVRHMVDYREIFTTPGHRWLVVDDSSGDLREFTTSTLKTGHTLARCKNFKLGGFTKDYVVESVEKTGIYEEVWCVVEPVDEVFTLADGILTRNCAFSVIDDPVRPFTWAMDMLMLGCGVGYRLLPEDISKLPPVKYALVTRKDTKDADFIVPDSREGWVKLLGKVLKAHFYSGQNFTYSCTLLRSKGAPIKSFGGLASGPEVLCDGLEKISGILNKRAGQRLRSVDALDIMNIIGMIVVSGNV